MVTPRTSHPAPPSRNAGLLALLLTGGSALLVVGLFLAAAMFSGGTGGGTGGRESPRQAKRNQQSCLNQQRQLAVAVQMYVQDNAGRYPKDLSELHAYLGAMRVFACPSDPVHAPIGYGYNAFLIGTRESAVKSPTSLLVLADGGDYAHLIHTAVDLSQTRHRGGFNAGFADGHVSYQQAGTAVALK